MLKEYPSSACPGVGAALLVNDVDFVGGLTHLLYGIPASEVTIKTLVGLIDDARRFYMARIFGIQAEAVSSVVPAPSIKCPFASTYVCDTEQPVYLPDSFHYCFHDGQGRRLHALTLDKLGPSTQNNLLVLVNNDTPATSGIPPDSVIVLVGKISDEAVRRIVSSKAAIYCADNFSTTWNILPSVKINATGSDLLELDLAKGVVPWTVFSRILAILPYLCPALGAETTHQLLATGLIPRECIYPGPSVLRLIREELSRLKHLDETVQADRLRELFQDVCFCSQ